jgi:hypothetical protein
MLHYVWKNQGRYIVIYFCVLIAMALVASVFGLNAVAIAGDWWGKVSSLLTVAALGVALLVWHGEVRENWEQSLPKLLTAIFVFQEKDGHATPVMACVDASLTGESDIRAMGQQIGLQLNGLSLGITPSIEVIEPRVDSKAHVKKYVAYFYLDRMPEKVAELRVQQPKAGLIRRLTKPKCWVVKVIENMEEAFPEVQST